MARKESVETSPAPRRSRVSRRRHGLPHHRRPRLRSDTRASLTVLEAVLASLLVFSGMLYISTVSVPTPSPDPQTELGRTANDVLRLLQETHPQTGIQYTDRLDEAVSEAVAGDPARLEDELQGLLPPGSRYLVRLHNGEDSLHLAPATTGAAIRPHVAQVGFTYILPDWTAYDAGPDVLVAPSGALDFSPWTALRAPDGSPTAPDGSSWLDWWSAARPAQDRVPAAVPLGTWQYEAPGCDPCHLGVTTPRGEFLERPAYALQLVVWRAV